MKRDLFHIALLALLATAAMANPPATPTRRGTVSVSDVLAKRHSFLENHSRIVRLLERLDVIAQQEPSSAALLTATELSHLLWPRKGESPRAHIKRCATFISSRHRQRPPLYDGAELHDPIRYLNVYGCGSEEDLGRILAAVLKQNTYRVSLYSHAGRTKLGVCFDGDRHGYLPTGAPTKIDSGWRQLSMPAVPPLPRSTDRPAARARRYYLDELFVTGTDGSQGSRFSLDTYQGIMANAISIRPLAESTGPGDELRLVDDLPIVAAFISVSPPTELAHCLYPPLLAVDLGSRRHWLTPNVKTSKEQRTYLDYSHGLAHLSPHVQYSLCFSRLGPLLQMDPFARLVTVHSYCLRNARQNETAPLRREQQQERPAEAVLALRREYLSRFTNRTGLIRRLKSKQPAKRILENTGQQIQHIRNSAAFPTTGMLVDKFRAVRHGRERALAIFQYVRSNFAVAVPLYTGPDHHWPSRFLTTYGCGWCDDAAFVLAELARLSDIQSRVWFLNGHVIAELYWDDSWHAFDVIGFGYLEHNGSIASLADLESGRFPRQRLGLYGNTVLSAADNTRWTWQAYQQTEPALSLYPGERRLFFDVPYMLATDGNLLIRFRINDARWSDYEAHVANFVRDIPLTSLPLDEGETILSDFFPFSGLFISCPDMVHTPLPKDLPLPEAAIVGLSPQRWLTGQPLDRTTLDLSPAIGHLEERPTHRVHLRRLRPLLRFAPQSRILTVHVFCRRNARELDRLSFE